MTSFQKDLEWLINKHGVDNELNTPDFVIASFVVSCMHALKAVRSSYPSETFAPIEALGRQYMTGSMSSGEFATRAMVILGLADPKDTRCSTGQLVGDKEYVGNDASGPLHYDTQQISQEITMNVLNRGDPRPIADRMVDEIVADMSDRRGLKREWNAIDDDTKKEIRSTWAAIIERFFIGLPTAKGDGLT